MAKKQKFKVGDRVQLKKGLEHEYGRPAEVPPQAAGVIEGINPCDDDARVAFDYGDWWYCRPSEVVAEKKERKAPNGPQTYRGNGEHTWELVVRERHAETARIRVPGGWLYRVTDLQNSVPITRTTTFVETPEVTGYKI